MTAPDWLGAPADAGSGEPLEHARLHVTSACRALADWHAGSSGEPVTGRPYTACGRDALAGIDAALAALHTARAALLGEIRADADARDARVDALLEQAAARRVAGQGVAR